MSEITVFTDGACSGNPGPGGWGAIIAAPERVWELGGGNRQTTNNQMELVAPTEAIRSLSETKGKVTICTDSKYVIQGITSWIFGWQKKGWKTASGGEVQNQEYWKTLLSQVQQRKKAGLGEIVWHHVRGHMGIDGNERADQIAVAFAQGESISLFEGERSDYSVDLTVPEASAASSSVKKKAPSGKAYSYLSYYGNEVRRHKTWTDCERWVKGRAGAKYKKAFSPQDERSVVEAWGLPVSTKIND